jgi:hypothetical protein
MKQQDILENAFQTLKEEKLPTKQQKEKMLKQVLLQEEAACDTLFSKAISFISTYPWRFALYVSSAQAVLFTVLFGTKYTNLFLRLF